MKKKADTILEELEYLSSKLNNLREAEDLAVQVNPGILPDLEKLHRMAVKQLVALARRILRRRIALGARAPRITIEHYECMFIVLRDQAEATWVRSMKTTGKRRDQSVPKQICSRNWREVRQQD
jgi:hypothetical protein